MSSGLYGGGLYGAGLYGSGGGGGVVGVPRATYILQVAWSAYNLGIFTFDFSTFDGTDTLGVSSFDTGFGGPYDDLSPLLRTGGWQRGSNDLLTRLYPGDASFTVRDPDNRFNPANAASPLYGVIESRLHPCQLSAIYGGVTYPLFYGWVRGDQAQPGNRRSFATLPCVDLFYWLDRAKPIIGSTGITTTGDVIGKILDAVGWIDPTLRALDVGDTIPDFSADGSKTATVLIGELLAAERGTFFHAGNGQATYRSRLRAFQGAATGTIITTSLPLIFAQTTAVYAYGSAASVGTIADRMSQISPQVDFDLVKNRVTVKRTQTGYTATAVNPASVNSIGYADLDAIETPYLVSDAQADDLASWILSQVASPTPPLRDLTIDNREDALLTQILAREITDRVTVVEASGGTTGDYVLQRLEHTLDEGGDHSATYMGTKAPSIVPFVFDASQFDSGSVLTY